MKNPQQPQLTSTLLTLHNGPMLKHSPCVQSQLPWETSVSELLTKQLTKSKCFHQSWLLPPVRLHMLTVAARTCCWLSREDFKVCNQAAKLFFTLTHTHSLNFTLIWSKMLYCRAGCHLEEQHCDTSRLKWQNTVEFSKERMGCWSGLSQPSAFIF